MSKAVRFGLRRPYLIAAALVAAVCCSCAERPKLSTIKVNGQAAPISGHVQVERNNKPVAVTDAMTLEPGDIIQTDGQTTVVVRQKDTLAIVMPNTRATLDELVDWFGRVFISGWLQGKTHLVTAAVKGTQYLLDVDKGSGLTVVSVLEGIVRVSSSENRFAPVDVKSAQRVRVAADTEETPAVKKIARDEYNELIVAANGARDPALDMLLVPDLGEVREQDAEAQLRKLGFQVSRSDVVAPTPKAVGLVVGQKPPAGTATRKVELQIGHAFKAGLDKVLLNAPAQVEAGSEIELSWVGPGEQHDQIVLVPVGAEDKLHYKELALPATAAGKTLRAPAEPGRYELRYLTTGSTGVLARTGVEVVTPTATLKAPSQATAGSVFKVEWQGPNHSDDKIYIVPAEFADGSSVERTDSALSAAARSGELRAPSVPGPCEIRYELSGRVFTRPQIIARARINVTSVEATISAPARVEAGAPFSLSWTGPNADEDRIFLVAVDTTDHEFVQDLQLNAKSGTGELRAPTAPGEYELRYALSGIGKQISGDILNRFAGVTVIARSRIQVTPANATLEASPKVDAGATLHVSWTGPKRAGDWVGIALTDSEDGTRWNDKDSWISADQGTGDLRAPVGAGTYELRYMLGGPRMNKDVAVARRQFTVTPVKATITAASSARAGATTTISWSGPNRKGDRIYLVSADMGDDRFFYDYILSAEPGRGTFTLPTRPGDYELRYSLGGPLLTGSPVIARAKLRITE